MAFLTVLLHQRRHVLVISDGPDKALWLVLLERASRGRNIGSLHGFAGKNRVQGVGEVVFGSGRATTASLKLVVNRALILPFQLPVEDDNLWRHLYAQQIGQTMFDVDKDRKRYVLALSVN